MYSIYCKQSGHACKLVQYTYDGFLQQKGNIHTILIVWNFRKVNSVCSRKGGRFIWRYERIRGKEKNCNEIGSMGIHLRPFEFVIYSLSLSLSRLKLSRLNLRSSSFILENSLLLPHKLCNYDLIAEKQ